MSEPKEAKMKLSERMRQNPIYDCIFDKYEGFHVSEEEIVEVEHIEETIDALIAVYDLTQRDVENALKKWVDKDQGDETTD